MFCVNALSDFFYPHLSETEDFSKHVAYCDLVGRIIMRDALKNNLVRFDDELKAQVCKSWKNLGKKKRTIITLVGEITYKRRVYIDEYGNRRYLLDEMLGIPQHCRIEPNAFLWIVRMASNVSFEKTAKAFKERSGTSITRQSVMRCVHNAGNLLSKIYERAPGDLPISTPVLFCEYDGFWVNLQSEVKRPALPRHTYKAQFRKKSTELKVWVAYAAKEDGKRIHPFHWATDTAPDGFFAESLKRTGSSYEIDDVAYLAYGADAASWSKANDIDANLPMKTKAIPKLDTYHINKRVYKAFTSEDDRSTYLDLLYSKNFDGFLSLLLRRIADEPEHERTEKRQELYTYIKSNLDWLESPSMSACIRHQLLEQLATVFCGRVWLGHLHDLLSRRRYKRFIEVLKEVTLRCDDSLKEGYQSFLDDAIEAIAMIRRYVGMGLGTMEGTNSKVYAARLKVWGCAWSKRGALAMMRIRAAIASGIELVAPSYNSQLTKKEKKRIETWRGRPFYVPETTGKGYEPPQGSVFDSNSLSYELFCLVRS